MWRTRWLVISTYFFFSSRRRHTRWTGDWSSDVCSSDLVKLAFSAAGIELGSTAVPINVEPDGKFVAYFRTTGSGRYFLAGNTTGQVVLLQGAATQAHQYFAVKLENRSRLTIPLIVTVISLYSLFWRINSVLRSLRRGRKRRSGAARLAALGAVGGVFLAVIAWIVGVGEPTVLSVVLAA